VLPPPLISSPHQAPLCHWPKTRSSTLSSPDYSLVDHQRTRPLALLTPADDQELLLSLGKSDHPIWDFGPSDFSGSESYCHVGGRRIRNDRFPSSSLYGQNPQHVLTIPSGSISGVVPMACTTPPTKDKVDTSLMEAPTAQALVTRLGNKTMDDILANDDPDLLNFDAVESKIACQMSSRL
jgi:hypothetical protein